MLKIGIIGLGDIAQKAYLPVIGQKNLEVHLHTRNTATLRQVMERYRFKHAHPTLESLLDSGITGAFVHAPTASHEKIVEQLLDRNIHIYVDKPITYDYGSSARLMAMARSRNLLLTVGFNRRYVPAYRKLKGMANPNMVLMQKNRKSLPGDVRTFIFDDFIHVVDTLLFLFPHAVEEWLVSGRKKDDSLYHVVLQLKSSDGSTAVGIMNRDSGTVEEKVEVFTSTEKRVVYNLMEVVENAGRNETPLTPENWSSTLHQRGFEQIIEEFLTALSSPSPHVYQQEVLHAHKMCEEIVAKLNANQEISAGLV